MKPSKTHTYTVLEKCLDKSKNTLSFFYYVPGNFQKFPIKWSFVTNSQSKISTFYYNKSVNFCLRVCHEAPFDWKHLKTDTVSGVLILNRYTLGVRRLTSALMVSASITSMNLRKILEYKIFMLWTAVHENDSDLKRKFEINIGF